MPEKPRQNSKKKPYRNSGQSFMADLDAIYFRGAEITEGEEGNKNTKEGGRER